LNQEENNVPDFMKAFPFNQAEEQEAPAFKKSRELYFETIDLYQEICEALVREPTVVCDGLKEKTDKIAAMLKEDERMLMGLANAPYSYVMNHTKKDILYFPIVAHGVNIAIYALKLLIDLGTPENQLSYLGLAGLLSHIGLLEQPEEHLLADSDSPNGHSEADDIKNIPDKFIEKIRIKDFHTDSIKALVSIVQQEQQFLSTTTLTQAIHQYTMVIHICDKYESLTHKKGYGEISSPIDAMKMLCDKMKDYFNQEIIKFFFNRLSIYPLGSYVQLSSLETAKIVKINDNFIMRPVVMIVLDGEGREKIPPIKLNLREKPTVYIKKALANEALYEKFINLF